MEEGKGGEAGLKQRNAKNLINPVTSLPSVTFQFFCATRKEVCSRGLSVAAAARTTTTTASNRLKSERQSRQEGEREEEGGGVSRGGAARTAGLARDWRSLRRLTDVPPGPLKGLLTHFDYSGPLVTQNITSSRTMNSRRHLSSL